MGNLSALIIILMAIAILLRLDFVFFVVYVLVGLWLLARFGFRRGLEKIAWRRVFTDHAFLGDQVEVTVEIKNNYWLPMPWLRITDSVPLNLFGGEKIRRVIPLKRGGYFAFRYHLDCNQRGYYTIGPLSFAGGDPLGLVEAIFHPSSKANLIVYPQILPLDALGIDSQQPFGNLRSHNSLFTDPSLLAGVRQYKTGDSIRSIHWKASAHLDQLRVKKIEPAIALESAILLNLNKDDYRQRSWQHVTEWGIVVSASIAYHLIQAGQAVGVHVNGEDPLTETDRTINLPVHTGKAHLMEILEVLARVSITTSGTFVAWLPQATTRLNWGTALMVITPEADEAILMALHHEARKGLKVILFVTEPYAHFDVISAQAKHFGIEAFNIARDSDLWQWSQTTQYSVFSHE